MARNPSYSSHCKDLLEEGERCQRCTCKWCGYGLRERFCLFCASRDGNSSIDAPNPNSFNDPPNVFTHPSQPQYETYTCELCGNDAHYGYYCPPRFPLESTIPLNEIVSQIPPSIAIIPVLPTLEPEDSFIMGDENVSTILEKELDEFIKSSVEDLVPIPSEFEDTSRSDSEYDLPSCNDFSPINVFEEKSVTFSNPLFDSNNDFTSSDDESLSDEDVPKDNVKIYSNPLFEFDDEYISSDENPLFDEVLEDIENKDSYVSKLDEPDLLVTPLSKLNEDECFDPGGDFILEEIEAYLTSDSIPSGIDDDDFDPEGDILLLEKLLNDDPLSPLPTKEFNFEELKVIKSDVSTDFEDDYYNSEGDIIYLESLLIKDTIPNLPPEVFLDHDPRSLEDEPDKDDLKNIVKVFDPGIWEKIFSPTYLKLPF
ncbi:hypothetical protein Tco_0923012 [Tanacetum coccineum]|uniref:Uncharacterized protein n=1 Tax=Tanacetum coccineum TaxID=301880 RepID=A0ABQ5D325_9ASTR